MGTQGLLHLLGKDFFAAGIDAGRAAAEHRDEAIIIEPAGITRDRPEPACHHLEGFGGFFRIIIIADGRVARSRDEAGFADRADTAIGDHLLIVACREPHQAIGAFFGHARDAGFRRPHAIGNAGGGHQRLQIILQMLREYRPARPQVHDRRQVPAARMGAQRIAQRRCHRIADELDEIGALALGNIQHAHRIERTRLVKNDGEAVQQRRPDRPGGGHVHQRRQRK